jgi:hypothetical protein
MDEDLLAQRREITGERPIALCEHCGRPLNDGEAKNLREGPLEKVDPENRMRLCPTCWEGVERGLVDLTTFEDDDEV